MTDIIELPKRLKPHEFETWDVLFKSGQLPFDRMVAILRDNPAFANWRKLVNGYSGDRASTLNSPPVLP